MKYITKSDGDICPTNCPCCADELVVLKAWGEWNYYLCESCKAIYDYKGNKLNEEDTKQILSELSIRGITNIYYKCYSKTVFSQKYT